MQDAIENIWDAIGARVVLQTGSDSEVGRFVDALVVAVQSERSKSLN